MATSTKTRRKKTPAKKKSRRTKAAEEAAAKDVVPPITPKRKPTTSKKAKAKKATARRERPAGHRGRDLIPSGQYQKRAGRKYWFWLGALPSAPRACLVYGGKSFAKMGEIVYDRQDGRPSQRVPFLGGVMQLSKEDIELIREHLRHGVLCFNDTAVTEIYTGCGYEVIKDGNPRQGHPIRIPRDDEIAAREKAGIPSKEYFEEEYDEAAADHVYAVLCDDQSNPRPRDILPPPVSETGLIWPE
jgi:hypothetical protein